MASQIRSDILIGNLEKKLGVPTEFIRHPNDREMRSDKKLGSLRKEAEKTNEAK